MANGRNLHQIKGQWKYLDRVVDTTGETIDFLLTAKWDATAVLRFFRKAIRHHDEPEAVTIDKSGASIGQDHRNMKRRTRPMLGFKSFQRAQTILAGIALIHMILKGQYQHPKSD